jgi:hypothetical protein
MKPLRTLGLLVVALAGLVAYLYFVDAEKPVGESDEKPKVFSVEAEQIEALKVSTIAGGDAELTKGADGWTLTSPQAVKADDSEVSGITSSLASVAVQRVVDENPSNLGDYGLKDPVVEVSFRAKGSTDFRTLQLGTKSPAGSDMYAKTADSPKVFLVYGYLESSFNRTPFDLRDKKILTFDRDKADRIEIRRGDALLTFSKANGEWRVTAPVEARGDVGAIEGVLSRLQSAQMRAVVEENATNFQQYGLEPPEMTVTVSAGSARAGVAFGSKNAEGLVHARDVSKSQVVTVPADVLTDFEKTAADFRRKDVFEFRAFNLDTLEITRSDKTTTFERLKGKGKDGADAWRNVTANKELDAAKFESLLTKLSGLRAQSFAEPADKTGLDAPAVTVKATFDDKKKTETVRIGRVGTDAFASRPDEPGAMKLDGPALDEMLKELDGF